jgi:hypothetical protein
MKEIIEQLMLKLQNEQKRAFQRSQVACGQASPRRNTLEEHTIIIYWEKEKKEPEKESQNREVDLSMAAKSIY